MTKRVIYIAAGPGNLIDAHRRWQKGEHEPSEVSITFSSQVQDFCRQLGVPAYLVSPHKNRQLLKDGSFTLEHRPKQLRTGLAFHFGELVYGIGLLRTALEFGADTAIVDSGASHYFVLALFRLFGLTVVPILHNAFWPAGFIPRSAGKQLVRRLDRVFWRWVPKAAIVVSPEITRQVQGERGAARYPIHQIVPLYLPEYFQAIRKPPVFDEQCFRIMFIGRVVREKGVFDILAMAQRLEQGHPGRVRWELCGRGPDLDELTRQRDAAGLQQVVTLRGWTSLEDLALVYERSHAAIVPTTSAFAEGLAATVSEAVLAGRPVITNSVVPALEVLRGACVEAKVDDVDSYVATILDLATNRQRYEALCAACPGLAAQYFDKERGLAATLHRILD